MTALLNALERLWLNTKLMLGFSSGLLIAAAIGYYTLSSLALLEGEMERIYELELLGISHIKEANINLIYMGRAMRQMMIAQDDATRDKARAQVAQARETLRKEMAEGRKRIFREEAIARHDQFQRNFAKFNENVEHAISLIEREKASPSEAAKFITSAEFIAAVNAADEDLDALSKIKERGSQQKLQEIKRQAETARSVTWLLLVVGLVLAVGFGVLVGNSIKRPSERLRKSVEGLAGGDVASPIPHADYPNEIGILARAIQVLQGIYRKAEDLRWTKSHAAELGAALQQAEDLQALAQLAISRLAQVLKAGIGAVYVADDTADQQGRLNLLASYGYGQRRHLNNSFAVGEGLVGQCAMEKLAITLTAPKEYLPISSGVGEATPACVAVLPILHNGRLLGVLEIASFQQFAEREMQLLDGLMPVLASSMEILNRNQRTRDLLVATQEQAERMEKQAAQLEEQAVEMEAQQADLLATENWFRGIIETAQEGMLVVDESGMIVLSNPQAERLLGFEPGGMLGRACSQMLPVCADGLQRGVSKDGMEIWLTLALSHLQARGNRGACVSVSLRPAKAGQVG